MNIHANKILKNKRRPIANGASQKQSGGDPAFRFIDNRSEVITQRKSQEMANNSPQAKHTGLPDDLKTGIEDLSAYSMDDVKVHYNSDKPAQFQARAYAQGTNIYLAPGQEKHLPHEAWHVVQQKQGRVTPTVRLRSGVHVNDDNSLEQEANAMGEKALLLESVQPTYSSTQLKKGRISENALQLVALSTSKLNVAGEDHLESGGERRVIERAYCQDVTGGGYWTEDAFKITVGQANVSADPTTYRFLGNLHTIVRLSSYFEREYKPLMNNIILDAAFRTSISLGPLIALAEKHWADTEGVPYPGPLTDQGLTTRDNILRRRFGELQRFKTSLDVLSKLNKRKLSSEERRSIRVHYEIIADARDKMVGNLMLTRDLDLLRSQKMHDSAQERSGTVGVWKIGDSHVADIKGRLPNLDPPSYNLLTKDEFNEHIADDPRLEYICENPTPSEARARGLFNKKR